MNESAIVLKQQIRTAKRHWLEYFCQRTYPKFLTAEDRANILPDSYRHRAEILQHLFLMAEDRLLYLRTRMGVYKKHFIQNDDYLKLVYGI